MTSSAYRVLFVCMGNICRSPTAHAVLRERVRREGLAGRVHVDSAATHDYHPGEPPDPRSQRHARRRGYDLSDLRARVLEDADFERADLILPMDEGNRASALARCPAVHQPKLRLLTGFCRRHRSASVPDPYYGGEAGFEHVLDLIEDACDGVLDHVRQQLAPRPAA
jgi:protein-tyrosine phosphatase